MARIRVPRKLSPFLLIAVAVLFVGNHYGWFDAPKAKLSATQPGLYNVSEFIDGDTIKVNMNGSIETVRFIGVDTPETHDPRKAVQCFGQAAAAFTKKTIGQNNIRLEADPLNTNRDRYNRLLRYIYLPDGTLVNAEIIKQGYGFAYLSFPFSKSDEFHQDELDARAANKGLWGSCDVNALTTGREQTNNAN